MKKINKKGFTLIELLVVLVILSIIMVIAIPSVTSSIERNKAKHKEQVIKLVESAAELYYDSNRNSFWQNHQNGQIKIKELIDSGFLSKDEAKDPFNENSTICGHVYRDELSLEWKFVENTNEADNECVPINK